MLAVAMMPVSIWSSPLLIGGLWALCACALAATVLASKPRERLSAGAIFGVLLGVAVIIVWDCGWMPDWLCYLI